MNILKANTATATLKMYNPITDMELYGTPNVLYSKYH